MKTKKRLLSAIVVLVLTIALASSTTYAWFTMNQDVSVDTMQFNIQSQNSDLYLAVSSVGTTGDPTSISDFKFKITTDEIFEAAGWSVNSRMYQLTTDEDGLTGNLPKGIYTRNTTTKTQRTSGIAASTTVSLTMVEREALATAAVNSIVNTDEKEAAQSILTAYSDDNTTHELGIVDAKTANTTVQSGTGTPAVKAAAENVYLILNQSSTNYITFDLHFASLTGYSIKLNKDSSITVPTGDNNSGTDITVPTGTFGAPLINSLTALKTALKGTTNGAFYKTYTDGANISTRGAYAARVGFTSEDIASSEMKIFDPTSKNATYDYDGEGFYDNAEAYNVAYQYEDYSIKQNDASGGYTYFAPAPNSIKTYNAAETAGNGDVLVELNSAFDTNYKIGTMTVSIWLEGNDSDCLNSILEDTFNVLLKFYGYKA